VRTVMVVAGEKFELAHIRSREGVAFVKVANGPGPLLAGEAMDAVRGRVDAVVSAGLCGAVNPELRLGDILVATDVNGEAAAMPRCRGRYRVGKMVSADRVVGTLAERRRLAAAGAQAVDMESAEVLRRARQMGVPFFCIRAVSDEAHEDWKLDLNAARGEDGRFRIGHILAQAARRPVTVVPELLRLRRNADLAARRLGEFFADCDF
jgi:adenosylhomocysteine nucleosidase